MLNFTLPLDNAQCLQRVILTYPSTQARDNVFCTCDMAWMLRGWWCFECDNTGLRKCSHEVPGAAMADSARVEPIQPATSSGPPARSTAQHQEAWVRIYDFDGDSTTIKYEYGETPTVLGVCQRLRLPTGRCKLVRHSDNAVLNIFDTLTMNAAYTVVKTKCPPCTDCGADCQRKEADHVLCTHALTESGDMHMWHAPHGRASKVRTPARDRLRTHVHLQGYVNGYGTKLEFTLDELAEELEKLCPVVFASRQAVADFEARLPVSDFKTAVQRLLPVTG